jgi:hypothetical protein
MGTMGSEIGENTEKRTQVLRSDTLENYEARRDAGAKTGLTAAAPATKESQQAPTQASPITFQPPEPVRTTSLGMLQEENAKIGDTRKQTTN